MGERHDLTYLSADESTDERTYERDARKLETVEAALFGRARCRLCESASRKADGDDDATAGAASRSETCSSGGLGSGSGEITSTSTRSATTRSGSTAE